MANSIGEEAVIAFLLYAIWLKTADVIIDQCGFFPWIMEQSVYN